MPFPSGSESYKPSRCGFWSLRGFTHALSQALFSTSSDPRRCKSPYSLSTKCSTLHSSFIRRYYANPQTGQIMFFYPQSGNQFVVEGFVIGFLNLACAGSLIFLTAFAPYFKVIAATPPSLFLPTSNLLSQDDNNRKIGIVSGLIAFAVCFRFVKNLYIMKNNWYGGRY